MASFSIVLAGFLSTQAAAQDATPDYARTGPYGAIGMAIGFDDSETIRFLNEATAVILPLLDPTDFGLPAGTTFPDAAVSVDTLLGVSLVYGNRFHPRYAVEGAFDWMEGDLDFELSAIIPPSVTPVSARATIGTYTAWMLTVNQKVFLLTGRVQPYALAGLGVMGVTIELSDASGGDSADATGFVPRFGGGVDVYVTKNIAINFEGSYLIATGDLDGENVTALRAGLLYRFQ